MSDTAKIQAVVLDAGPLITQTASALQQYASEYYTTPGVHAELKDEHARQQLILWGDKLNVRHPKPEFIQKVISFAKLTGDYSVLSVNDLHIIALAYELEVERNNGDWRLRKFPGEQLQLKKQQEEKKEEDATKTKEDEEDGFTVVEHKPKQGNSNRPRRRGGRRQREKREAELRKQMEQGNSEEFESVTDDTITQVEETTVPEETETQATTESTEDVNIEAHDETSETYELTEEYNEEDDDGEWITPDNLQEELLKDNNEETQEASATGPLIKVALATGDFACQNVAMQININLLNAMSGKQIKRVRNYMYRCHACFRLTPINKNGQPKHFCPKCGGNTLLRCAVSVDTLTGKVTPHLKANFQWYKRGERFTLPSPLSKNSQKKQGNAGYQHNKENRHKSLQSPLILREDQKEYQQALKNDEWQRRQNEKMLQEWIGGGSADNYVSPFSTNMNNIRPSGVRVGRGRFVNSSKGKKK
ncbi:uncharacterized protein SPAPADRAFT_62301 [Spathaspora passalidarum NRRL Y-27907]|uniref:20S-pre-rRNA D-site endonuclease NOB1 n=1 Tax=Spathaspora passalidarum (strain NRRL Y-27907 / 11-Y1) TaxID=619300 RepID=G3AR34_SPAPN|nr:uncharacterized protein SPAPADRAFT_62301 [Spathaspora passalidarum NRRL Y-27907]EGW31695.1 hypothetical protein SPAPADRAFT_62301 [Spathaspora passalidarum NRRL Y-27907]